MKIICTDYDGTLNHGGITEKKLLAIKKWKEKGNLFCVVSGRGKEFYSELAEKNIPVDYLLACNGAVITDKNYNIVSDVRCESPVALPLIEFLFSQNCSFANVCKDKSFCVANEQFPEEEGIYLKDIKSVEYFNQISTACSDFNEAARVTALVKERFGKWLTPLQNGTCIDIVPLGMDKAQGIYKLLSLVGGEKADVIAVGDNVNDEAMIKEFYSYAMENGVDSIKKLADRKTFGIEELIEKELQNDKKRI